MGSWGLCWSPTLTTLRTLVLFPAPGTLRTLREAAHAHLGGAPRRWLERGSNPRPPKPWGFFDGAGQDALAAWLEVEKPPVLASGNGGGATHLGVGCSNGKR